MPTPFETLIGTFPLGTRVYSNTACEFGTVVDVSNYYLFIRWDDNTSGRVAGHETGSLNIIG